MHNREVGYDYIQHLTLLLDKPTTTNDILWHTLIATLCDQKEMIEYMDSRIIELEKEMIK